MVNGEGRISAYLWSWRVYSIFDDYLSKRPAQELDLVAEINDRPTHGDSLIIRFGALPPGYYDIRKQVGASLRALLGVPSEYKNLGRDGFIDSIFGQVEVEPPPGNTWLTLELRRPVRLTADAASHYLWNDMNECEPLVESFREDMLPTFDAISACLCILHPEWVDHPQAEPERIYIRGEGKGPTFVPSFSMGQPTVSIQREWTELPIDALNDAAMVAAPLLKSSPDELTAPAAWLTEARREAHRQSDDPFRRFMFAYFGLEMLANKFVKARRVEVVDKIAAKAQVPLDQLIWPLPDDESSDPFRSAVFKFALMAVELSDDPTKDIEAFRPLQKKRNKIAHGSSIDLHTLPAAGAEDLLKRYLGLVAQDSSKRHASITEPQGRDPA